MARIDLVDLAHSYSGDNAAPESFALKPVTMTWRQGGAYALLGPSGCGKTTLLNLISGIVAPSRGKILFDGTDITPLSTQKRNIAQVFQFPVIYDTMTVGQNLAFPLKNRGVERSEILARVAEIRLARSSLSTVASRSCMSTWMVTRRSSPMRSIGIRSTRSLSVTRSRRFVGEPDPPPGPSA